MYFTITQIIGLLVVSVKFSRTMTYRSLHQGADYSLYASLVLSNLHKNRELPVRVGADFRIITYNVHFLKDRNFKTTYHGMVQDVVQYDPTVICFQEVRLRYILVQKLY